MKFLLEYSTEQVIDKDLNTRREVLGTIILSAASKVQAEEMGERLKPCFLNNTPGIELELDDVAFLVEPLAQYIRRLEQQGSALLAT